MYTKTRICAISLYNELSSILTNQIEAQTNFSIDIINNSDGIKKCSTKYKPALILFFYINSNLNTDIPPRCKECFDHIPMLYIANAKSCKDLQTHLKSGIDDFILTPINNSELFIRIQKILEKSNNKVINETKQFLKEKYGLQHIVGEDTSFIQAVKRLVTISKHDVTVLLLGETGTGKELFARALHYLSHRAKKPFIPVNCGAIPVELFENELFGHTKGAYTDARAPQKGYIAEADSGSLFLDEIDSMPLMAQVKLLRFLEEQQYKPLGHNKYMHANVRLIAASNTNLIDSDIKTNFRKDLLYRINVFNIQIPPLRERKSDIPILTQFFIDKFSKSYNVRKKNISQTALQKLLQYDWPGNIRELENVIRRCIITKQKLNIEADDIDIPLKFDNLSNNNTSFRIAKAKIIEKFEKEFIIKLLSDCHGNIQLASKLAQMDRKNLYRLIKKHKISRSRNFGQSEEEYRNFLTP